MPQPLDDPAEPAHVVRGAAAPPVSTVSAACSRTQQDRPARAAGEANPRPRERGHRHPRRPGRRLNLDAAPSAATRPVMLGPTPQIACMQPRSYGNHTDMAGRRGRRKSGKKAAGSRARSAITGRFTKLSTARKNPRTTVVESTKRKGKSKRKRRAGARAARKGKRR